MCHEFMILFSAYITRVLFPPRLSQCVKRHTGKMAVPEEPQQNRGQGSVLHGNWIET